MLELTGISKSYGKTQANANINLTLKSGQIHALLGENGAGKSTLMKILFGLVQPDAGEIRLRGRPITISNPQDAKAQGIGMVQQHFALFDGMTALENIALGLPHRHRPSDLRSKIAEVSALYGLRVDPDALILTLSAGQKQRIEIVRALLGNPEILVLDEPTSVLTPQEAQTLFLALKKLADEGRGLIFISHKLGEIKALCHTATVLRGGRVVGTCDPRETDTDTLAEMMIGRRPMNQVSKVYKSQTPRVLQVENVSTKSGLDIKTLDIHAGEIVGVAGIAGNGQDRLFSLISGEVPEPGLGAGSLILSGVDIQSKSPNQRRKLGARFVPEERLGHAAIPDFRLGENALLTKFSTHRVPRTWFHRRWVHKMAEDIRDRFDVRGGDRQARARSFSGGNLQKFVVGRELDKDITFLLINQPTWGVDLWAASRIRQEILSMADQGCAILLISQDLDELLALCDKLAVLCQGQLTKAYPTGDWSVAALGRAMAGEDYRAVA